MDNTKVLQQIKQAVSLDAARLVAIFALGGESIDEATTQAMLSEASAPDFVPCKGDTLLCFLNGLILDQRGQRPTADKGPEPQPEPLSNNVVLKKLRIALQLKEDGVLRILDAGGTALSKRQLGALARRRGNKHYRVCSDEVLASFLDGLVTSDWRTALPDEAAPTQS